MKLVAHSALGAEVEMCDGRRLAFDFRASAQELEPLFSGSSWGTMLWDASLVMAQHLEQREGAAGIVGKRVLELGACCGLPGMVCALMGAERAVLTDLSEYMEPLEAALAKNSAVVPAGRAVARELTWGRAQAEAFVAEHGQVDLVLASECVSTDVYGRQSWEALVDVLEIVCRGRVLICSARRPGDGLDEFLALVAARFAGHAVVDSACVLPEGAVSAQLRLEMHEFRCVAAS